MENIEKKLIDVVGSYLRGEEGNITRERIKEVLNKAVEMLKALSVRVSENDKDEAYEQLLEVYNLYVVTSVGKFKTTDGYRVKITAERDGKDATLPFLNHLACALIDAKHYAESNHLTAIAEMYRDEFVAICDAGNELEGRK